MHRPFVSTTSHPHCHCLVSFLWCVVEKPVIERSRPFLFTIFDTSLCNGFLYPVIRCVDTIRNFATPALRGPWLTRQDIAARLVWGTDHINWILPQWRNVLFTMSPGSDYVMTANRMRVWRQPGRTARLTFATEVVTVNNRDILVVGQDLSTYH